MISFVCVRFALLRVEAVRPKAGNLIRTRVAGFLFICPSPFSPQVLGDIVRVKGNLFFGTNRLLPPPHNGRSQFQFDRRLAHTHTDRLVVALLPARASDSDAFRFVVGSTARRAFPRHAFSKRQAGQALHRTERRKKAESIGGPRPS